MVGHPVQTVSMVRPGFGGKKQISILLCAESPAILFFKNVTF
ncbi:hypothetical protein Cabys_3339 [Caldithrix abyssi DSM 13497]|uniref:Uncharacterized protein n=1 Tax=Caldithrix abyssi DSM 13497 TaxID=880073 RepID=A0A1J1CBM8_CALAY|nr:hypothetical protein Cabys_3339 [Caldithrix abyssi DSM 13497]